MSDSKWDSHWDDNRGDNVSDPSYYGFKEYVDPNYAATESINTNKLAENYTIEYIYNQMKEMLRVEIDKKIIDNIIAYPIEIEHKFDFGDYHQYIRYNYPPIINYMPVIMYPDVFYDVPQIDDEEDREGLRYL